MSKSQFDVIIVGAGPAGAVLSYLLARSGVDVLLVERDTSFEKEFRGPAYQPCTLEYFNQMGILDELLLIDHSILHEFSITDRGKTLFTLNMGSLNKPYNYALAMQQGPFLRKLIQLASEFPNLTFLGNTAVSGLVIQNGIVSGVKTSIDNKQQVISSRLVVAADGRFSTLRNAAGIELDKAKQQFDVVWFDLPIEKSEDYEFGLEISEDGIVVLIPQEKDHIRVGWVLNKGDYPKLQKEGIEKFREKLIASKPILADILPKVLTSIDQCSYLDVKIAIAKQWTKDGLLLIGDAAHIASPVGAQGNKLAIQDAVFAHPLIMQGLKNHSGIINTNDLKDFVKERKIETAKIFRLQQFLSTILLSIRNPFIDKIRRLVFPLVQKYIAPKIMSMMAYGTQKLCVDNTWFQYQSDYGKLHRYYLLKIAKVVYETKDAFSFYFEIPDSHKHEFYYQPGQFITLRMLDKGQLHKRCYSLSSDPEEDRLLRITVKRVKKGLISNDMIDIYKENDELLVLPPAGQFVTSLDSSRFVMFAGGSGITPIMSLIRSLVKKPHVQHIKLIYANHDKDSIIFKNDLENLEQKYADKLQIIHNLTISHPEWNGLTGRLNKDKINNLLSSYGNETDYFLCGPNELMNLVKEVLKEKKINDSKVHIETFTSLAEPFEEIHAATTETSLVVGIGEEAADTETKTVTVKIYGQETKITCRQNESILDAAIRENLDPPFSCREGICSTCIAKLESGKIVMHRHQALSESEAKSGKVLTCQARPLTKNCTVNYD